MHKALVGHTPMMAQHTFFAPYLSMKITFFSMDFATFRLQIQYGSFRYFLLQSPVSED